MIAQNVNATRFASVSCSPLVADAKSPSTVWSEGGLRQYSGSSLVKGDISLVDFGFYVIGDRQRVEVDSSPHVKFTSDKTTFRAIARNDGQPWVKSPLTPQNNGPTMSPFVTLATRA